VFGVAEQKRYKGESGVDDLHDLKLYFGNLLGMIRLGMNIIRRVANGRVASYSAGNKKLP